MACSLVKMNRVRAHGKLIDSESCRHSAYLRWRSSRYALVDDCVCPLELGEGATLSWLFEKEEGGDRPYREHNLISSSCRANEGKASL